jgi:predicted ATPase
MTTSDQKRNAGEKPIQAPDCELDYITIKGFRSIKSIERMDLRRINVLIGANGSGKSNFLATFSLLQALREGKLVDYVERSGGAEKILHFGSKSTSEIELELSFSDVKNGYRIILSPTTADRLYVRDEWCWDWEETSRRPSARRPTGSGKEARISVGQKRAPRSIQSRLDGLRIYHFHDTSESAPVKKTASLDDNRFLRKDASNLASYLYFLSTNHHQEYQLICKTVQRVAPFFHTLHLEPLRRDPQSIKLEWIHKSSDAYFDASALSDGTLRFLCLSTLFLQPPAIRPPVILVDEPELGLHPYAITMLANLIKTAAYKTQIIVSTQSALLLDHFQPEDVLVAELEGGSTCLERLRSTDLAAWLDEYSLGQLWEKNQFGGRPARA